MAACANCAQPFAGTPWRYDEEGQRIHVDCRERPPEAPLGGPGNAHLRPNPAPAWGNRGQTRVRNDQVRWRQLAQEHATWSSFARDVLKQRYPISPGQGAVLDKMERQAGRRRSRPRRRR